MVQVKKNKAICIMNMAGLGGAEHRYVNLFNYITREREDFYLIVNDRLYEFLNEKDMLHSHSNIKVISLGGGKLKHKSGFRSFKDKTREVQQESKEKSNFLKLTLRWLWFACHFIFICQKYKITTVYGIWLGGIWSWKLCKLMRIPLIYSVNSTRSQSFDSSLKNIFQSQLNVLKRADFLDFHSKGLLKEIKKNVPEIRSDRFSIAPCSFVNYSSFYPVFPKIERAVYSSRLENVKNPMLFLKAVKWFNEHYAHSLEKEFLILGEGEMHSQMENYIVENKLVNVKLLGFEKYPWRFLRESKIYISIQQKENYPSQSLMEAMACENAIIASDVGYTRLLISEKEGFLVDLNAPAIGDALIKLFENKDARREMGISARQKVLEKHNIEAYANYFYSHFE